MYLLVWKDRKGKVFQPKENELYNTPRVKRFFMPVSRVQPVRKPRIIKKINMLQGLLTVVYK